MSFVSKAAAPMVLSLMVAAPAFASPDVYLVNFRHAKNTQSQQLDSQLPMAIELAKINAEEVIIDTTTAAKWEKSAHDAFNRNIVPVFNKWVGLPGFVAVVDAKNKTVIGCIDATRTASDMALDMKTMADAASGEARLVNASTAPAGSPCPATYNQPLG
jgi:hypothetical protein